MEPSFDLFMQNLGPFQIYRNERTYYIRGESEIFHEVSIVAKKHSYECRSKRRVCTNDLYRVTYPSVVNDLFENIIFVPPNLREILHRVEIQWTLRVLSNPNTGCGIHCP